MGPLPHRLAVGKEISTHCNKCKAEMIHAITKIVDGQIKKVFCKGCNTTRMYKPDGAVAVKKTRKSATGTSAAPRRRKRDWATLLTDISDEQVVDYEVGKDFTQVSAIRHKKFGIGVITKVVDRTKIEVVFQEFTKILAQNWQ